jgi:hypothetical protein
MKNKLLLITLFTLTIHTSFAQGLWQPLFNGENLDGWKTVGDQNWSVEDGAIVAKAGGKEMGWLVTENPHENFVLRFRFKWMGGNSGIQVRSEIRDGKMYGYHANLDINRPNATGSILDENGRGMLGESHIKADAYFKKEDWNTYEIMASGSHLTTYVNGYKTADIHDPDGLNKNLIALV